MDPATLKLIALSTLPTGCVSLIAFLLFWWRTPHLRADPIPPHSIRRQLLPVLLFAVCATAMYSMIFQSPFPPFPPERGRHAIAYVGIAALLAGITWVGLARLAPRRALVLSVALGVAMLLAVVWLALRNQLKAEGGWSKWSPVVTVFIPLAGAFTWGAWLMARRAGVASAVSLFVTAFGASQVLVLTYHSISECIMAASLCAVVGGLVFASLFRPHASLGAAGGGILAILLSSLLLQGAAFGVSDMPWRFIAAAAIAVAPWTGLGAEAMARRARIARPWALGACTIAGTTLPVIFVVAAAGRLYMQEASQAM